MSPMVHPGGQLGWHAPVYIETSVPTMQALAAMQTPSILITQGGVLPPAMAATAMLLLPSVTVQGPPVVVPLLTATAAMGTPTIHVDSPMVSALMAAVAQMLPPTLSAGIGFTAPLMAATAAMRAPTVGVGVGIPIAAVPMTANAALLAPTIGAGITLSAPLLHATAAMPVPTVAADVGMLAPLMGATAAMPAPTVTITPAGPQFDAAGSSVQATSGTTLTSTIAPSAGATVLAFVSTTGTATPTSATCGGTAMTALSPSVAIDNTSSFGTLKIFKLAGVAAGSQSVVATMTGAANTNRLITVSYGGVTTVGTPSTAYGVTIVTGGTASHALTCSSNQIIVQSFAQTATATITSWGGGTVRASGNNIAIQDATANATFTETLGGNINWASIGVVLS